MWHAPTTQAKDRKRMLRLLIKDITVEKPADQKQLLVHIRWQGGACSDVSVQLPPNIADRVRYPAAVVDRVRELAHSLPDGRSPIGSIEKDSSAPRASRITVKIDPVDPLPLSDSAGQAQEPEELTVQQVAETFWRQR